MRKLQLVILALAICLPAVTLRAPASASRSRRDLKSFAPGEVIVKLKEGARHFALPDAGEHLSMMARSLGERYGPMREMHVEPLASALRDRRAGEILARRGLDRTFVLRFDLDADIDSIIARLESDEAVEYATPNYRVKPGTLLPDDPRFDKQWALRNLGIPMEGRAFKLDADIKATEAWEITTGDPDVIVAVTDTGIDINHPDLVGRIYVNDGEIPGNGIDDDGNGYIDDINGFNVADMNPDISDIIGHGTQMAGIMAAGLNNKLGISGVSRATILPVRFFKFTGPDPIFDIEATVADAARSLIYSIQVGATIINASWFTLLFDATFDEVIALQDAVKATNDAGILFVTIAGNDGFDNDVSKVYPAAYQLPNQIVAGASDFNDGIWRSGFNVISGFGANTVHLAAPGVSVLTTSARGQCLLCVDSDNPDDWYSFIDGTSASAAYVSGVAALVKSRYPDDNALLIRRRILDGVDKLESLRDANGRPYVVDGGRLNAVGALTSQPQINPPVLTKVKYKVNKGKLILFGENILPGVVAIVGDTPYLLTRKETDPPRFIARVPQSEFPVGASVAIKIRNPDGGVSQTLTVTR